MFKDIKSKISRALKQTAPGSSDQENNDDDDAHMDESELEVPPKGETKAEIKENIRAKELMLHRMVLDPLAESLPPSATEPEAVPQEIPEPVPSVEQPQNQFPTTITTQDLIRELSNAAQREIQKIGKKRRAFLEDVLETQPDAEVTEPKSENQPIMAEDPQPKSSPKQPQTDLPVFPIAPILTEAKRCESQPPQTAPPPQQAKPIGAIIRTGARPPQPRPQQRPQQSVPPSSLPQQNMSAPAGNSTPTGPAQFPQAQLAAQQSGTAAQKRPGTPRSIPNSIPASNLQGTPLSNIDTALSTPIQERPARSPSNLLPRQPEITLKHRLSNLFDHEESDFEERVLDEVVEVTIATDTINWRLPGSELMPGRDSVNEKAMLAMAKGLDTPKHSLIWLSSHRNTEIRAAVARNTNTPFEILWLLAKDEETGIRMTLAELSTTPAELLEYLTRDKSALVSWRAQNSLKLRTGGELNQAINTATRLKYKESLTKIAPCNINSIDDLEFVQQTDQEQHTEPPVAETCPDDGLEFLRIVAERETTPPPRLAELSRHSCADIRQRVAANPSTPIETLWRLARNDEVSVKLALTKNDCCPLEIIRLLGKEAEEAVATEAKAMLKRLSGLL